MAAGKSGHVFKNWCFAHSCKPELYFEPTCEDDIRQVLAAAREKRKTVKVVGCGHSFNDIACTDDYMISLKQMNRVIEIDKVNSTVKVEAGILISELNEILVQNDLALSVCGLLSNMTLGGVVCTGYHGSGITFGALEDYVLELSLMLGSGDVMTLNGDENDEIFHAARLSLGALGIIVSVKLQCEPAFSLQQNTYPAKLDDVIDNIDVHLSSSDHFRFTWFPNTDRCAVHDVSRTTQPVSVNPSNWFWDTFVGYNWLLEFLFWISTFIPFVVSWLNRLYSLLLTQLVLFVDRSDRVFTAVRFTVPNVSGEWCVPRVKFASAMRELVRLADDEVYLNCPVDVRFVRRSDKCLLSPQSDADTVYFNILQWRPYGKSASYEDRLFAAVQSAMLKFGGKPHWGKKHDLTYSQLSSLYNTQLQRFVDVRNKLDPQRIFTNDYLRRVLED